MPQMGVSVSEGTIVEGRKQAGDRAGYEGAIVDTSTDKIDTEVPSPAAGRLAEVVVEVGTTVDVGTVLARIAPDPRPGEGQAREGRGNDGPPGWGAASAARRTRAPPRSGPAGARARAPPPAPHPPSPEPAAAVPDDA